MIPLTKVHGRRIAIVAALCAVACLKDGDAVFDNEGLGNDAAAGNSGLAGTKATGGDSSTAGSSLGGSSSEAGNSGSGAKAGSQSQAGSAGQAAAGSAGSAGTAEEGGTSGSGGMAGHAGSKPNPLPEPVTVSISGFEDAYVVSCDAFDNYGSEATINVDGDNDCTYQGLIRPLLDVLPAGALVSEATLTLECVNFGSSIMASYIDEEWSEGSVTWINRPDAGISIGSVACQALGPVTIDLTAAIKVWLAGETPYGLYLRGQASNGIDFASSEAEDTDTRPVLSVTYVLPVK